jgi:replicative DNA helicase
MAIHSLQVEKHVLGGLIKHPGAFSEVAPFVSEKEFFNDVHSTIFLVIRSCFEKQEKWDKVLLAEKIRNLGVSFKDDINIYDYIDNLSFIPITFPATIEAAKELIKVRIRRELESTADEIKNLVRQNGNDSLDDLIGKVDEIFGNKTSIYERDKQPIELFGNIEELVEERGNNPTDETGLKTPYKEFNRMYGGLKTKQIYAFASRPGQGKTTLLTDLCLKTCMINNIKAIMCDTEMSTEDIQLRQAAARAGVPLWYIDTGMWRKNKDMTERVRASLKRIKEDPSYRLIWHFHVGNKNIDQICSIVRRWHYAHVKKGDKGIFSYDYLKLVGQLSKNWAEHQAMGENVDKIKRLTEELDVVNTTAIQLNRTGENFNRQSQDVTDDGSAVAISDRLQWFAAFLGIFRRKTLDEISLDGPEFGTHKLIPVKTRFQGRDAAGHHDLVRRVNEDGDTKYVNNYLNFQVDNFDIQEVGSLRDIVARENQNNPPNDRNPNDTPPL